MDIDEIEDGINRNDFYLKNTDWLIIRAMDSGVAVPDGVKAARQTAREELDRYRALKEQFVEVEDGTD